MTTNEEVTVRAADLQHILDVYIDNGMVEAEDEEIVNRLWAVLHPTPGNIADLRTKIDKLRANYDEELAKCKDNAKQVTRLTIETYHKLDNLATEVKSLRDENDPQWDALRVATKSLAEKLIKEGFRIASEAGLPTSDPR